MFAILPPNIKPKPPPTIVPKGGKKNEPILAPTPAPANFPTLSIATFFKAVSKSVFPSI